MSEDGPADTGVMTSLKRRETAISLIRTSVRYFAYGLPLILALGALSFGNRIGTVAGASLIVVLVGFAAQRFLTDILAGFFMFFEGWFSVGDNISISPLNLQGVVDEVGLRSTRLRAISGEIVRVHNSYIQSVQVQPRGAREVEIEFFATSEEAGRELVAEVARLVPGRADPARARALGRGGRASRRRARADPRPGDRRPRPRVARRDVPARPAEGAGRGRDRARADRVARRRVGISASSRARSACASARPDLLVAPGRLAAVADPNVRKAAVRPTPEQYFMLLAVATRERAACLGRHVGAMLVADQRIIATGYNGTPTGFPQLRRGRLPPLRAPRRLRPRPRLRRLHLRPRRAERAAAGRPARLHGAVGALLHDAAPLLRLPEGALPGGRERRALPERVGCRPTRSRPRRTPS